jgi:hypothetical protein
VQTALAEAQGEFAEARQDKVARMDLRDSVGDILSSVPSTRESAERFTAEVDDAVLRGEDDDETERRLVVARLRQDPKIDGLTEDMIDDGLQAMVKDARAQESAEYEGTLAGISVPEAERELVEAVAAARPPSPAPKAITEEELDSMSVEDLDSWMNSQSAA